MWREEDGTNVEVRDPRPIKIHDLSFKVKEKPSLFLNVLCLKVWDVFWLTGALKE